MIHNSSDISCDGSSRSTRFKTVEKARLEYNNLRKEKLSVLRHRKFLFGAVYESIFPGYHVVDPLLCDYDLVVMLPSGKVSEMRIRLVAPDDFVEKTHVLSALVDLGRSLSGPGNARGFRVGDIGSMHAIGIKSVTTNDVNKTSEGTNRKGAVSSNVLYKTSESTNKKVTVASNVMREWLEDHMRDVLGEIVRTDKALDIQYPPAMPRGPGSRLMVSVNLANSPHYDSGDSAKSIAIWVEEKPGQAENWFFVLPNVSHKGKQGLVVKLCHGVVISWDGREIYHCSSKATQGDGNKTYGCMWSSSRSK